ncbi:MAG: FKBP-type peptidyl-prolyl cis-trans isomerase [Gammaproteobacteria bacterium]|nr:FKBP-type peptidyl-prolyl cis-trans isomerase [Gammaproteobacteria bacterium]
MSAGAAVGPGSEVVLHLELRLEDGTVAESSFADEPVRVVLGDGTLIEGLERALYGLHAGDRQTLRIGPDEGFGRRDPAAIQPMPRSEFPADMALEPGLIIGFTTPAGDEVPGAIREVGEERVTVDFNHPLAGHEVTFEAEILEVIPPKGDDPGKPRS